MKSLDLSFKIILIHFANFWVDWFMDFFADADCYWVEESKPFKQIKAPISNEIVCNQKISISQPKRSISWHSNKIQFGLNFNSIYKTISKIESSVICVSTLLKMKYWIFLKKLFIDYCLQIFKLNISFEANTKHHDTLYINQLFSACLKTGHLQR